MVEGEVLDEENYSYNLNACSYLSLPEVTHISKMALSTFWTICSLM